MDKLISHLERADGEKEGTGLKRGERERYEQVGEGRKGKKGE